MSGVRISVEEAKQDKLFYVVANIIIVNADDKTCLFLKRSGSEKVHPGKWAFPGGKLEHGDIAQDLEASGIAPIEGVDNVLGKLAEREGREECGLDVNAQSAAILKNKVFIRPDGIPVFLVLMAAKYAGGEVALEEDAFTDYAWVARDKLADYDTIEGVAEEAAAAIDLLAV